MLLMRIRQSFSEMAFSNRWAALGCLLLGLAWQSLHDSAASRQAEAAVSPSGPDYVFKKIEEIQVGDYVVARDEETGEMASKPVIEVYRRMTDELRILQVQSLAPLSISPDVTRNAHQAGPRAGGPTSSPDQFQVALPVVDDSIQRIETTDEHPFWVKDRGWVDAGDLQPNDELTDSYGNSAKPGTVRPIWYAGKHPVLEIPAAMPKNATEEAIPLLPLFEDLLLTVPEEHRMGWVFNPEAVKHKFNRPNAAGRLSTDWVGKMITRIGERAGIIVHDGNEKASRKPRYASAHDLRRSCIQRMIDANVKFEIVQRIARHASFETTKRHYIGDNIQRDAKALRVYLGTVKGAN